MGVGGPAGGTTGAGGGAAAVACPYPGYAGEPAAGAPGHPCPLATPAPAASAATEARSPFLIERSLGCPGPWSGASHPSALARCRMNPVSAVYTSAGATPPHKKLGAI